MRPEKKSGAMDEETYILLGMFRSLYVEVSSRLLADVVQDATHTIRVVLDWDIWYVSLMLRENNSQHGLHSLRMLWGGG